MNTTNTTTDVYDFEKFAEPIYFITLKSIILALLFDTFFTCFLYNLFTKKKNDLLPRVIDGNVDDYELKTIEMNVPGPGYRTHKESYTEYNYRIEYLKKINTAKLHLNTIKILIWLGLIIYRSVNNYYYYDKGYQILTQILNINVQYYLLNHFWKPDFEKTNILGKISIIIQGIWCIINPLIIMAFILIPYFIYMPVALCNIIIVSLLFGICYFIHMYFMKSFNKTMLNAYLGGLMGTFYICSLILLIDLFQYMINHSWVETVKYFFTTKYNFTTWKYEDILVIF
ncbi:MAG: hypothetical protein Edafosvirus1_147 [Edafosvirus sp.]|uniref:Uncharacterized protein n=1 Tax=Edafosvirus sp. TaxID=2487765 RepID=A0A3G4ZSE0_9VIRU|nr:MAG: hypothetical protein Edafosvirus1_147 [Edafosvirus sp.]